MLRDTIKAGLFAGTALVAPQGAAIAQETYPDLTIRYAYPYPSTLLQSQNIQDWADTIRERSGGKVKINIFWSAQLAGATEDLAIVSSGGVEMSSAVPAYYPNEMPLTGVLQLPRTYPTPLAASEVIEALIQTEEIQAELERNNVRLLFGSTLPSYHILCTTKIDEVSDFAGTKQRAYGEYIPRMWDAVGAVPVVTTAAEQYEGLQRGLVDCIYSADDYAFNARLHEVADYYSDLNFGAIMHVPTFVNLDAWNSWPQNVRDLILEAGAELIAEDRREVPENSRQALDSMLEAGVEMVEFTETEAFDAATPVFLDMWVEQLAERGLGEQASSIADVIRQTVSNTAN
ncbi:C4-dicarboxylate TRAP transporter substrate-binding protein [Frigidibacter oleivorans]|uniref:C4-dicarboxylate TRAP transporter substrate-binding protein n=1 Tax=Frigidibacter oleivorans TaxID=2487129 RepID=UPI000F8D102B|nr:C4-dicarboxylate TRAP transporter substrate-binding protein [Frigidibacter oleivorans]